MDRTVRDGSVIVVSRACETRRIGDMEMTPEEREEFVADVHVGILAIERESKAPLAVPIWYREEMASRYLGSELGKWYAENNPSTAASIVARLRPEQWITCDFGKMTA
jgi:nitroimidazol reductase NimA-like FMN-containing flavoprotein (pyridoxamine 5'-phosphate oxidase superfamily)